MSVISWLGYMLTRRRLLPYSLFNELRNQALQNLGRR